MTKARRVLQKLTLRTQIIISPFVLTTIRIHLSVNETITLHENVKLTISSWYDKTNKRGTNGCSRWREQQQRIKEENIGGSYKYLFPGKREKTNKSIWETRTSGQQTSTSAKQNPEKFEYEPAKNDNTKPTLLQCSQCSRPIQC